MTDLIDKYVEYASIACDAPRIFHLACSYWICSSLLGRFVRIVTSYAPEGLMANLWVLLVGPSRIVRKTTAQKMAEKIVEAVDPNILMSVSFTPEALYQLFNNMKKGDTVAWTKDELGGFFKMLQKRYMAGLRELLNSLYVGKGELRYLRSGVLKIPEGIYVTWIANLQTPPHEFIDEEDFYSGFMNRWILAHATRREKTNPITFRGDDTLTAMRNEIIERYKEYIGNYDSILPITFNTQASQMLNDYDRLVEEEIMRLEKENPSTLWKSYLAEAPMFLLKLSSLRRLARGPPDGLIVVVTEQDVVKASMDLKLFLDSASKVVLDVETAGRSAPLITQEKSIMKVYEIIRNAGANGISKSELLVRTMLNRNTLNEILATLAEQEKIVAVKVQIKNKPQMRFYTAEYKYQAEMSGQVLSVDQLKAVLKY